MLADVTRDPRNSWTYLRTHGMNKLQANADFSLDEQFDFDNIGAVHGCINFSEHEVASQKLRQPPVDGYVKVNIDFAENMSS